MRLKHVLLAAVVAAALGLATPRSHAQVVAGGYLGFGSPGVVTYGAPVVAPAPFVATPVLPYATGYPVVVPRPWIGSPYYYGAGWGYGPGYYGVRRGYYGHHYHRGYGRYRW
jgi:hypothetical protein